MSPKKPAKRATKSVNVLTLAENVEQEFRKLPTKLAQLYNQELVALKLQTTRLTEALNKTELLQKAAQKKQLALAKVKTATGKKQWAAAKKAYARATQLIKELVKKHDQADKTRVVLSAKQEKYTLLAKQLPILEKQLLKKNKPVKKRKPVTKQLKVLPKPLETVNPLHEISADLSPSVETVE